MGKQNHLSYDFCFSHFIIHNHGQRQRRVHSQIENHYCQRLTELVDMKMFDEAHAIFEEFSLGDDESYQWFFIKFEDDGSETLSIEDETNR